jgi:Flp pilus assembly protein TadG
MNHVMNLGTAIKRLPGDCRGVTAVEFALMLPLMLTLFLGSVETSQGVATQRKVSLTVHALADVATQYTDITNADMTNILNAGAAIIAPYPAQQLTEVISELSINAQGQASVVWSDTLGGTARTAGQVVNIPTALAVPNTYLIMAETQFSYTPSYGYVLTGTITLTDQSYMLPRQSTSIARTAT